MIFISIHYGHNATVGLSINGQVKALISEERITRIKNFIGFPIESLRLIKKKYLEDDFSNVSKFVLIDETGQSLNYLKKRKFKSDNFVSGNIKQKNNKNFNNSVLYNIIPRIIINNVAKVKRQTKNQLFKLIFDKKKTLREIFKIHPDINFNLDKAIFYNHHEMHALSCQFFIDTHENENLIFTMDGEGDQSSSTVNFLDKKNNFYRISNNSNDCSVGYFYSQATEYLGLKAFQHEFKVMGMAPYGNEKDVDRIYNKIKHLLKLDHNGKFVSYVVSSLFKHEFAKLFFKEKFQDICGAVQKMTEKLIIEWISFWIKKKSIKNIVVSGGVFMNIKACKEILNLKIVDSLFVVPSSTDESLVFGALWKINNENKINIKKVNNLYFGRNFEDEADKFIKDNSLEKKYDVKRFHSFKELNNEVSILLQEDKIIGRCVGREEWGARALGNRSIICNPSKLDNIRLINSTIKERDYWMPFSPTILDEDEKKYFYNIKNFGNEYMTCLFDSTDLAKKDLTCAMHPIDFTLRPQVITKEQNPKYYDLIKKFKEKSGIGAILNTSFNLHGYPNVSSHKDALFTFENSKLEFLIIENFLLKKI